MSGGREAMVQVRRLRTATALVDRLAELGCELPLDEAASGPGGADPSGPLAEPLDLPDGLPAAGNRFTVLPMEGWDGTTDGRPTDLVRRRWRRFGRSGAKLIWGGEAVAVVAEGRANPRQLCLGPESVGDLSGLRAELVAAHVQAAGGDPSAADDLVIGLQLTHSGRWSRPEGVPSPRTAQRIPVLDDRVGAGDAAMLTDTELDDLIDAFVHGARVAAEAGFDFVDIKQCHGYLLHELLGARDRTGAYGGDDLGWRTRFVRSVIDAVQAEVPGLAVGSRLSLYDVVPQASGPDGTGTADPGAPRPWRWGFSVQESEVGASDTPELAETHELVELLAASGVHLLCATAGSPYWSPHVQRPAFFPPSDGYQPPRDPIVDAVVLARATAEVALAHPGVTMVGSGLTYFQDWLPLVAQSLVRRGWMASAGIGRMVLSYPELPADVLAGRPLDRRLVCRTFSDCTTAPRNGLVSGCYPLDEHYKAMPERRELARVKRRSR